MHLLSDGCNLINLGSKFGSKFVIVRNSKVIIKSLEKIYDLNFISGFRVVDNKKIKVFLKYNNFHPVLRNIYTLSKPSKKFFLKKKNIKSLSAKSSCNGFFVISTDKGFLTDIECVLFSRGGKAMLEIA